MEEEYRMQKAHTDSQIHSPSKVIHEDGTVMVTSPKRGASLQGKAAADDDDDASTRGMISPTVSTPDHTGLGEKPEGEPESEAESATLASTNGLPTIRISTESAREEKAAAAAAANGHEEANEAKENGVTESASPTLEKPVQAAENPEGEGGQAPSQEPFSFSNKRLCERWLDNLFMVLYEVRVALVLLRFVPEFEFFLSTIGSARLDDLPCGGRALQDTARCVPQDRAGVGDPGRPRRPLAPQGGGEGGVPALPRHSALLIQAVVEASGHVFGRRRHPTVAPGRCPGGCIPVGRVCRDDSMPFQSFFFCHPLLTDFMHQYPTQIARCFFKLGQIHGHAKIQWSQLSMGLPEPVMKIMESYLAYGRTFKVEGYDF